MERQREVASLLRQLGRQVKELEYANHHDLVVDGKWIMEVKAARFSPNTLDWVFNIHRHGEIGEQPDAYILRLEGIPYSNAALHYLLLAPVIKKTIRLTLRGLLNGSGRHAQAFKCFARTGKLLRRELHNDSKAVA